MTSKGLSPCKQIIGCHTDKSLVKPRPPTAHRRVKIRASGMICCRCKDTLPEGFLSFGSQLPVCCKCCSMDMNVKYPRVLSSSGDKPCSNHEFCAGCATDKVEFKVNTQEVYLCSRCSDAWIVSCEPRSVKAEDGRELSAVERALPGVGYPGYLYQGQVVDQREQLLNCKKWMVIHFSGKPPHLALCLFVN